MRKNIFRVLLLLVVLTIGLYATGDNYVTFFLRGGENVSLSSDSIQKIYTTGPDADNGHVNGEQVIETTDSVYRFDLADVDSIRFVMEEKVEEAKVAMDEFADELTQLDDEADFKSYVSAKIEDIRNMDGVADAIAGETSIAVEYSNGMKVLYPYHTKSAFDFGNFPEEVKQQVKRRSQRNPNEEYFDATVKDAEVVIFDFYRREEGGEVQSMMMQQAADLFENAGYKVFYTALYGYNNLRDALQSEKVKYIFLSAPGDDSCFWQEDDYLIATPYTYEPGTKYWNLYYNGRIHEVINYKRLIQEKVIGKKYIYLTSCNAADRDFSAWKDNVCLAAWDSWNYGGQAVGLIMADYFATYQYGLKAFRKDFGEGIFNDVHDPCRMGALATLEFQGDLEIGEQSYNANNNYSSFSESSDKNGIEISNPDNLKHIDYSDYLPIYNGEKLMKYGVDYNFKVTLDEVMVSLTKYDYSDLYIGFDNFNAISYLTNTLQENDIYNDSNDTPYSSASQIWDNRYYTISGVLCPGVTRVELYRKGWGGKRMVDVKYFVADNGFFMNDSGEDAEELTDETETCEAEVYEDRVVLHGRISKKGVSDTQNGFIYWEKGNPGESTVVYSNQAATEFTVTLNSLKPYTTYRYQALSAVPGYNLLGRAMEFTTLSMTSFPTGDHEYVDLGLPSGTLWATCNVGANSPEEVGNYYAWGETKPKDRYSNDNYFDRSYNKYNNEGGKTTLDLDDDAAYMNWGDGWRMPTYEEMNELKKRCEWRWISRNGVTGFDVTGPNGNSIFMPAGGGMYEQQLLGAKVYGTYWSSTLDSGFEYANLYGLGINFASPSSDTDWSWESSRWDGQTIRPVYAPTPSTDNHEYVDLGLSVKWATCNVGANKPEEYGEYYAWGETETKSKYSEQNYFDTNDGGKTYNKYNDTGGLKVLEAEDDVAHVKWGGNWRMPTDAEQDELIENCSCEWTSRGGIKGYIVTGPSGKSIFLPAAGIRGRYSAEGQGSHGDYLSNSLYNYKYSKGLRFYYDGDVGRYAGSRYVGQSVRPVYSEKQQNPDQERYLNVSKYDYTIEADGGNICLEYMSNAHCDLWPDVDWISRSSGKTINIQKNTSENSRKGQVVIHSPQYGFTETVTITQSGTPIQHYLNVSKQTYSVAASGGSIKIEYSSDVPCTLSEDVNWISLDENTAQVLANNTSDKRTAKITIANNQ